VKPKGHKEKANQAYPYPSTLERVIPMPVKATSRSTSVKLQRRRQSTLSQDRKRLNALMAELRGVIQKEGDHACVACDRRHGAC
jgi:hypothetical protein